MIEIERGCVVFFRFIAPAVLSIERKPITPPPHPEGFESLGMADVRIFMMKSSYFMMRSPYL